MAFKLKQMDLISSSEYQLLFHLNISVKFKSLVLLCLIFQKFSSQSTYLEYKNFFSSDRRLWHLSIRMRQIS